VSTVRRGIRRFKSIAISLASIIAFLLLWEAATLVVNSPFFPGPYSVFLAFIRISTVGDFDGYTLGWHSAVSLYRVLLGFMAGAVTGIPLGLFMGIKLAVKDIATPIIEPLRFIPPMAWIPLSIVLLIGLERYVFLIWVGAFFPILLNTIAGVRRTSITLVNVARTFGADDNAVLRHIIFPSALPEIMTGLRVGLGIGWMCIVAAEMMGGDPVGLGRLIIKYANFLQIDVVIVGMVAIGLLGLAMNYFILLLEKRMFRWRVEVTT
jgi:ABC-type nitrate/sulfonate/bicarbonate transport system permease component